MQRRLAVGSGLAATATFVAVVVVGALTLGTGPTSPSLVGAGNAGHPSPVGGSSPMMPSGAGVEPTPGSRGGDGGGRLAPTGGAAPVGATSAGWRRAFDWHVPVLMYHLVSLPAQAGDALAGLVVSPSLFRDQLQAARQAGWRTITAAQLATDMQAGAEPPPRTFVITIDDGNADGWTEAYPILQTVGFVATYFVPTGRIGRAGDLSAAEIVALSQAGMEIGNHTVSHVPLARVSATEAIAQVTAAQAALTNLLGAPPITLAYPYGNRDQQVMDDAAVSGIDLAFTTVGGCSETPAARLDEPRLRVTPWTSPADLLNELGRCAAMPAWG